MTRTGINPNMLSILHQPTPPEETKQRQGNRRHDGNCVKQYGVCQLPHAMLDYIDARYVMSKLDELGPEHWQDRYEDRSDGSVRCGIGILVDGEWVWKWDVGDPSDIEANKGVHSEAFKRAGVKWGIARDLYDHPTSAPAGSSPAARPAAPRTVTPPPSGGAPQEPDYLAATFDHEERADGSTCPVHGLAWVLRPGGTSKTTGKPYGPFWACPSTDRPYCKEKPSAAWAARQEMTA